jgi:hypothetical protein
MQWPALRETWWPLAVAVAWVLLRSRSVVEKLLALHSRKPITRLEVDLHVAAARADGATPRFANSGAAFRELKPHLETGEIGIAGKPFRRIGDPGGIQRTIPCVEISLLHFSENRGVPYFVSHDWQQGYRDPLVQSAPLVRYFPEGPPWRDALKRAGALIIGIVRNIVPFKKVSSDAPASSETPAPATLVRLYSPAGDVPENEHASTTVPASARTPAPGTDEAAPPTSPAAEPVASPVTPEQEAVAERGAEPAIAPPPWQRPGDSQADARARWFLYCFMQRYPEGRKYRDRKGGATKDDFWRHCETRCGIAGRRFEAIWNWCIDETGATDYRKGGPRGPHT